MNKSAIYMIKGKYKLYMVQGNHPNQKSHFFLQILSLTQFIVQNPLTEEEWFPRGIYSNTTESICMNGFLGLFKKLGTCLVKKKKMSQYYESFCRQYLNWHWYSEFWNIVMGPTISVVVYGKQIMSFKSPKGCPFCGQSGEGKSFAQTQGYGANSLTLSHETW